MRVLSVVLCAGLFLILPLQAGTQDPPAGEAGPMPAVQAWTFNRFSAFEAVEMTAQAGAGFIEFYPGQRLGGDMPEARMGPDMGSEAMQALKEHLARHGVRPVAYGVTNIDRDEASARKLFEWAREMGIGILNTESTGAIDTIEKLVKEFDVKVGFHNHPRRENDPNYRVWDPAYVLELVKDRDPRIGACADTGHWVRSGIRPVDALKILEGRIVSSHLKDLHEFSRAGHDVPFGTGVSDIPGILDELHRQGFTGTLSVEYEHNWDRSLPEVAQCIGFLRGHMAARGGTR
jgi:sugar phosphate isomerase/epimerase